MRLRNEYRTEAYEISDEINSQSLEATIGFLRCFSALGFDEIYFDGENATITIYKSNKIEQIASREIVEKG